MATHTPVKRAAPVSLDAVSRAMELHRFPNSLVQFTQRYHAAVYRENLIDLQFAGSSR
jgi:hypothetical protein